MESIDNAIDNFLQSLLDNNCHETFDIELKEAGVQLPQSFWETYSSFANTAGGYIILGMKEKPVVTVTGVSDAHKLITDMCNLANSKEKVSANLIENDNIYVRQINGKTVVVVYVPEMNEAQKPLYLKGNLKYTYIRKNEGDYLATTEDL